MKPFYKTVALIFIALVMINCGGTPSDKQKKVTIDRILEEFNDCVAEAESNKDCKEFVARAICEYNGIKDFVDDGRYVDYHEIYEIVSEEKDWELLGYATDLEVLKEAQKLANEDVPVIAINTNDKHKFTVLIIKGELSKSTKWGGEVPMCAAFFPASSKMESFINKSVNFAWSKPEGIAFYARQ
jgi:hypothetical protein